MKKKYKYLQIFISGIAAKQINYSRIKDVLHPDLKGNFKNWPRDPQSWPQVAIAAFISTPGKKPYRNDLNLLDLPHLLPNVFPFLATVKMKKSRNKISEIGSQLVVWLGKKFYCMNFTIVNFSNYFHFQPFFFRFFNFHRESKCEVRFSRAFLEQANFIDFYVCLFCRIKVHFKFSIFNQSPMFCWNMWARFIREFDFQVYILLYFDDTEIL